MYILVGKTKIMENESGENSNKHYLIKARPSEEQKRALISFMEQNLHVARNQ